MATGNWLSTLQLNSLGISWQPLTRIILPLGDIAGIRQRC